MACLIKAVNTFEKNLRGLVILPRLYIYTSIGKGLICTWVQHRQGEWVTVDRCQQKNNCSALRRWLRSELGLCLTNKIIYLFKHLNTPLKGVDFVGNMNWLWKVWKFYYKNLTALERRLKILNCPNINSHERKKLIFKVFSLMLKKKLFWTKRITYLIRLLFLQWMRIRIINTMQYSSVPQSNHQISTFHREISNYDTSGLGQGQTE